MQHIPIMNEKRTYKNLIRWAFGWKTLSSDPKHDSPLEQYKSNLRRFFSRLTFATVIAFFVWAVFFAKKNPINIKAAYAFLFWGLFFFYYVVLRTPFRSGMKVNAARLLLDTILCAAYFICSFSLIYSLLKTSKCNSDIFDHLYFSTVTFSTLGYGDIHPSEASQGYAALEAILGNLHLGIIVGATFAAIAKPRK